MPGMCFMLIVPSSFQSCIAKNLMSMCRDLPVGLFAFMISIADLLSSHVGVGFAMGMPNSCSTDLTHLMFFAAVTAAIGSASVELGAVVD